MKHSLRNGMVFTIWTKWFRNLCKWTNFFIDAHSKSHVFECMYKRSKYKKTGCFFKRLFASACFLLMMPLSHGQETYDYTIVTIPNNAKLSKDVVINADEVRLQNVYTEGHQLTINTRILKITGRWSTGGIFSFFNTNAPGTVCHSLSASWGKNGRNATRERPAENGTNGEDGRQGANVSPITIIAEQIVGKIRISNYGQSGQEGGTNGIGGRGIYDHTCSRCMDRFKKDRLRALPGCHDCVVIQPDGEDGIPGKGGNGGNGGNIFFASGSAISKFDISAFGGWGGQGGWTRSLHKQSTSNGFPGSSMPKEEKYFGQRGQDVVIQKLGFGDNYASEKREVIDRWIDFQIVRDIIKNTSDTLIFIDFVKPTIDDLTSELIRDLVLNDDFGHELTIKPEDFASIINSWRAVADFFANKDHFKKLGLDALILKDIELLTAAFASVINKDLDDQEKLEQATNLFSELKTLSDQTFDEVAKKAVSSCEGVHQWHQQASSFSGTPVQFISVPVCEDPTIFEKDPYASFSLYTPYKPEPVQDDAFVYENVILTKETIVEYIPRQTQTPAIHGALEASKGETEIKTRVVTKSETVNVPAGTEVAKSTKQNVLSVDRSKPQSQADLINRVLKLADDYESVKVGP